MHGLQLEAKFKPGWCALVTMPLLQLSSYLLLLISFYVSLILGHSFESICVICSYLKNICAHSSFWWEKYLSVSMLSMQSALRESPHPQSICVITHLSPVSGLTNLYWRRVIFDPWRHQMLGFWKWLEVSSCEVDQLQSHWRFPGVELGWGKFKVSGLRWLSLKSVCWRFRELVPCSEEHVMMWQC